ncbi:helix-turn-helix domain-containing protein [Streptomyces asoensis]|uniref:helix-turn-helix domain-containing protein n=1 Tax=Streptomyces asoensis TaxID=249586 RepID=UPI00331A57BB
MARRENPIPRCSRSLLALVVWLRAGRAQAGLSYEQLASRTDYSADTLARAASGRSVPQNPAVILAYARACGRNTKEAERMWKHARRDEARAQGVLSGHRSGVHISVVKDFADLHSAIVDLYHDDGSPPLRSLDARLGGVGRLPHSTVGRVLKGSSTPNRTFVAAFAEACNVRRADMPEWMKAWDRADADRRSSRMRSRKPRHAQQRLIVHNRITPRDLQLLMSELESSARKEPALKLLVHVPDPKNTEAEAAARMSRELLIDQAQRRGELACPQCHRPSFGYRDGEGWRAQLCDDCALLPPQGASIPRGEVPSAAARLADMPTPPLHGSTAGRVGSPVTDTPTLSLHLSSPITRPPLPKRMTTRDWPAPASPSPRPPLEANSLATVNEPLDPRPGPPAHPTAMPTHDCPCQDPSLSSSVPDQPEPRPTDWFGGAKINRAPATPPPPLGTRIRINIPGTRPIPPVAFREAPQPAPDPPNGTPEKDASREEADTRAATSCSKTCPARCLAHAAPDQCRT